MEDAMVVDANGSLSGDQLWVFELAGYDSWENAVEPKTVETPRETAAALLAWALPSAKRAVAIRRRSRRRFWFSQDEFSSWLSVLCSPADLQMAVPSLARLMADGFCVDIGLSIEADHIVAWFESKDYKVAASSSLSSHRDATFLQQAVTSDRLHLHKSLGCTAIVVSGHDMDFAYVIRIT